MSLYYIVAKILPEMVLNLLNLWYLYPMPARPRASQTKGSKMSSSTKAPKSVLDTNNSIDAGLKLDYLATISAGEDANIANLNFITTLNDRMKSGLTQSVAIATLKETAKGIKVGVVVKHGHITSISIAAQIIAKFESEIVAEQSASKVLTLASRILSDKKASGAKAHIAKAETYKELDETTLSKAESQARDKGETIKDEVHAKADAITLESIMDALDIYLSAQDLKTLKTSDLEKLHKVIARLITVEKNSKVA